MCTPTYVVLERISILASLQSGRGGVVIK